MAGGQSKPNVTKKYPLQQFGAKIVKNPVTTDIQSSKESQSQEIQAYSRFFTPNANAAHTAPEAAARPFQIFSLYDAATPVVYTNHTR